MLACIQGGHACLRLVYVCFGGVHASVVRHYDLVVQGLVGQVLAAVGGCVAVVNCHILVLSRHRFATILRVIHEDLLTGSLNHLLAVLRLEVLWLFKICV